LTILQIVWAPGMRLFPHDHDMWACIGIYAGSEDNEFFRRSPGGRGGLRPTGGKRLEPGTATLLGDDVIHAVANPSTVAATAAIHVYGGDFMARPRSQWLEPALLEEPYDMAAVTARFDEANERWARARGGTP
ncbi:MAG TPA: hypothetical protein VHM65_00865, partial [Candidatus Lustribacter sp.]|nr:hypothetical protein [Candidatus Lustribacter sp.]